ncbi:MAG: carboxypeptidase regulatory-like domain-containing protein [Bryobacterales bacterium]|nr:carboxypeptidase regulatory-like domain-containing protein [Bryobacterales bacterium]
MLHRAIVRRVLGMAGLAALTMGAALAQTGAIAGKVIGEDGQPMKGAWIVITRTDIKGDYMVESNKKGEFFHAGLPLGTYNVQCNVGGKKTKGKIEGGQVVDQMNGVRTRLGDPVEVNFSLVERAARQKAVQKAAETGQLTAEMSREMSKEDRERLEKQMKERAAAMAKNKELNDAFNAGMTALSAKNWDEAVTQFAKASEMDPKQHVVWANLAESYIGQAGAKPAEAQPIMDKGLDAWSKAIELKPDAPEYHNNYALALAKAKKYPEAEAELTKAAQLDPPKAGTYFYNLGAVLTNIGQLEPAGSAFKKAIEADPSHADAQYQYGIYLMSKATTTADGKVIPPDGTLQAFQKYIELKPTGPFADSAKGMIQMMDATLSTTYQNPDAKKAPKKKK